MGNPAHAQRNKGLNLNMASCYDMVAAVGCLKDLSDLTKGYSSLCVWTFCAVRFPASFGW